MSKRTFVVEWTNCGIESYVEAKNEEEAIAVFKEHAKQALGIEEVNEDSIKRVYELKTK